MKPSVTNTFIAILLALAACSSDKDRIVEALSESTEKPKIEIKICEGNKDVCDAVYREGTLHIFTYDE